MAARVANFLPHYPTPGGTTNAVRGLSQALVRLGWDAIIYCYAQDSRPPGQDWDGNVRVIRLRAPNSVNRFQANRDLLDRLFCNRDEIDLLVVHGMFNPGNLRVGKAAKDAGIPYVVCPHDPYHPELLKKNRWRKLAYGSLFERRFLNASSGIQLLAEAHRKFLFDYGVRAHSFVVPNGFDPEELAACEAEPGDRSAIPGSPKLLHLGRLDMHHKGLDLLLEGVAAAIFRGQLPCTTILDFIGSDWGDQNKLQVIAQQLGIAENVRFLGRVAARNPTAIIGSYDLLIFSSRFDGFGLAALEAMVAATPVVVSEEAGIAALVRRAGCGYLVKPTASSIAAGLAFAVQTRDRWEELGKRGRQFAYQHLTWEESAKQAIRSYEKILGISASLQDSELELTESLAKV